MNIVDEIKKNLNDMTKSESQIAGYCIGNLNDFAFDTLDVVAEKIGTSTTSVIRFCRKMGFDGFKSFQTEIRAGFKYQPSLPDKFQRTAGVDISDGLLDKTVKQNILCIEKTFENIPYERIYQAVDCILNARRVFTFGMKESLAVAHYAYTRILTVRNDVFMLSQGYNFEIESFLSMGKDDVCIVFLFHRYTKQTLKVMDVLKKQGVPIILITSPPCEQINDKADIIIPCYVEADGIKNSAVSPVCIADFICNALASELGGKALEYMKQSEEIFEEFSMFEY